MVERRRNRSVPWTCHDVQLTGLRAKKRLRVSLVEGRKIRLYICNWTGVDWRGLEGPGGRRKVVQCLDIFLRG